MVDPNSLFMRASLLFVITVLFAIAVIAQEPIPSPAVALPLPAKSTVNAFIVYEETGRPVKRTSVLLLPLERNNRGGREVSGVTDNAGHVEFKNVQAGRYVSLINAPGVITPFAFMDIRGRGDDVLGEEVYALPSIVVDGLSNIDVHIAAVRGAAISGRITYPDGDPAIGVSVTILRKVGDEFVPSIPGFAAMGAMMMGGDGMFKTDDRGIYRFTGLPAGEYIVKVTENVQHSKSAKSPYAAGFESILLGSSSMVTVFFQNALAKENAELIKATLGQEVSEINIVIPDRDLKRVTGKVVAAKDKLPVRNARVTIKRDGDETVENQYRESPMTTYSDSKGLWEFQELPAGKYSVVVVAENSEYDEKDKAYGPDVDEGDKWSGYAANANRAVANAMNAAGYAMNSAANGYKTAEQKPPARKFAKQTHEFEIGDKEPVEQVVELTRGGTVSGTVTVENNGELPGGVGIEVSDKEGNVSGSGRISNMSYDDDYSPKKLKDGEFKIEAISAGQKLLKVTVSDAEYYVKSANLGETDLLKDPVDFKEAEDVRNVKIVLARDVGTLKGNTVDEESRSAPRRTINLVPADKDKMRNETYYRTTKSDDDGNFEIKLQPLEYAAVVFPPNFKRMSRTERQNWLVEAVKNAQTFKIEAGKTQNAAIKQKAQAAKK